VLELCSLAVVHHARCTPLSVLEGTISRIVRDCPKLGFFCGFAVFGPINDRILVLQPEGPVSLQLSLSAVVMALC